MQNIAGIRALAARYARALFETAVAEADPRAIERDLAGFNALFDQYPPLRRALWNPVVPVPRKQAIVGEITRLGGVALPLEKLLKLLAERDHLAVIPAMLDAYRRRLMDHLGIVQAQVTTATPLGDAQRAALQQALSRATGKQVTMNAAVDPSIVGGVVTRVDSTVYDGSVARQLERIRAKIVEGA